MNKDRHYGLDLLRVLVFIFLILGNNFLLGGGITKNIHNPYFIPGWFLTNISFFVVNWFTMITGYVWGEHKFKYSELFQHWVEVFFWSILFGIVALSTGNINWAEFIKCFFPIIYNKYWYITAYFILVFLIPGLNSRVEQLNKKQLKHLITCLVVLAMTIGWFNGETMSLGLNSLWLSVAYLIGAYEKKHGDLFNWLAKIRSKLNFVGIFIFPIIMVFLQYAFVALEHSNGNLVKFILNTYVQTVPQEANTDFMMWIGALTSPIVIIASIYIFEVFRTYNIKHQGMVKFLEFVTPGLLSIYLILSNPYIIALSTDKFKFILHMPYLSGIIVIILITILMCIASILVGVFELYVFKILKINKIIFRLGRILDGHLHGEHLIE